MASLAEIRAKLLSDNQKQSSAMSGNAGDNTLFPHWYIADDSTTTLRFLADKDPHNTFFWVERNLIKLPFAGIVGDTNSKTVYVQVPCMETWGESCPILNEVRPWFKDPSLEDTARAYWKKRSYLMQGFVTDTSMKEENLPENPIRRFIISSQIFKIVKNALLDPEIEETPTDSFRGLDFKVTKTVKGGYADYTTSSWARRERALTADENAAIAQHGLFNLADFLPKKPTAADLVIIKEMFEASVDGEAYDTARWGQYYKPSGMGGKSEAAGDSTTAPATRTVTPTARPAATLTQTDDDFDDIPFLVDASATPAATAAPAEPVVTPAAGADASDRAKDILAMIRSRQKA